MGNKQFGGVVIMQEQARKNIFDDDEILRDFINTIPGVPDISKSIPPDPCE